MAHFYESLDKPAQYNEFYLNDNTDTGLAVRVEAQNTDNSDDTSIYTLSQGYRQYQGVEEDKGNNL